MYVSMKHFVVFLSQSFRFLLNKRCGLIITLLNEQSLETALQYNNHILGSIVVSIRACHVRDPGSIPGRGVQLFANRTKNFETQRQIERRSIIFTNVASISNKIFAYIPAAKILCSVPVPVRSSSWTVDPRSRIGPRFRAKYSIFSAKNYNMKSIKGIKISEHF